MIKALIFFMIYMSAPAALARNIYLNGVDISSAKHQLLEGVVVKIDGRGNIYIEAPNYEVSEETTLIPLSKWKTPMGKPTHQKPGPMPSGLSKVGPKAIKLGAKGSADEKPASEPPALQPKDGQKADDGKQ